LLVLSLFALCAWQSASGYVAERPPKSYCTSAALAALIAVPKLEYKCGENEDASLESWERSSAIHYYLEDLTTLFAKRSWWNVSANELSACAITNEVRALTKDEEEELIDKRDVFGDNQTRLVTSIDPCVHYSYSTINGFVLQRAGRETAVSQVLNAYYSRIDGSVDFYLASQAGERLAVVETATSDGMMPPMPYTTVNVFYIDPVSHRAVPRMLFINDKGLTNQFRYDNYVFDDEHLADQWKAPVLFPKGRFSPCFDVMTLNDQRFSRQTYSWNGRYFDISGAKAQGPKLVRKNSRKSFKGLIDELAAAYSDRDLGRLDAAWRLSRDVLVSIQLEMTEEIEARGRFNSFEQIERFLRRHENDDGLPFREARKFNCSHGTCEADLDGGIDHNHLYLKTIKYRYVGGKLHLTSILLWEG